MESPVAGVDGGGTGIHWAPIIAGAIVAAALALVLHSFALALGLSVSSPAPTWRDASFALVFLSGLYLVLVAVISYGLGGYIAGRLRPTISGAAVEDVDFRDGMHGLLVWGLATLLAGLLAIAALQAAPRLAAPSSGGSAGPAASVAGENVIAFDLDRLFRGERRPQGDMSYTRGEASRILLTVNSHRGMLPEDRAYLVRLVQATTGLAPPEAERRVQDVVTRADENLKRARRSALLIGFMVGVSALLGAAAAWFAACAAGRYRDRREAIPTLFDWSVKHGS
jgi:hypothetical protein